MARNDPNGLNAFKTGFYILIGIQLAEVIILTIFINKMSVPVALFSYFTYTITVGLTLSVIFFTYTQEDISFAFFITAFSFACLSAFGFFTKKDLSFIGKFCMMGLFGLIGFMIYGFFVPSVMTDKMQWMTAAVGIIVFAGLTAYDTQKIKNLALSNNESTLTQASIMGALILYLDFLNLFLSILKMLGRRR